MWKKIILILSAVIIGVIFFVNPYLSDAIKDKMESQASKILGVDVTIDDFEISILTGSAEVTGLSIANPPGFLSYKAFYFDKIAAQVDVFSVFSDIVVIKHIAIIRPEINYEIAIGETNINMIQSNIADKKAENTNNYGDNLSADVGSAGGNNGSNSGSKFIIEDLKITKIKVMTRLGGGVQTIEIPEIHLQNIGKDGQEKSFRDVSVQIMGAVLTALSQADINLVLGGVIEQMDRAKSQIKQGVKDVENIMRNMFGK